MGRAHRDRSRGSFPPRTFGSGASRSNTACVCHQRGISQPRRSSVRGYDARWRLLGLAWLRSFPYRFSLCLDVSQILLGLLAHRLIGVPALNRHGALDLLAPEPQRANRLILGLDLLGVQKPTV